MNYPIYLTNMNRVTTTRKMVEDLLRLNPDAKITIIDNASTYPPLLEWYKEVEDKITIRRLDANHGPWVFFYGNIFNECEEDYYIYSDADLELNPNMPANWQEIMFNYHKKYNVKCSLAPKIDDLPPDRKDQILRHLNPQIAFQPVAGSDEIFTGITDMSFSFDSKEAGYRFESVKLAGEMECRHIPFYNDFDNLSEEEQYFLDALPENLPDVFWTKIAKERSKKKIIMTRGCKMVALYPPRNTRMGTTNSPLTVQDWMECVNRLVEGETNVYPGDNISLDLHLVWNRESRDDEKEIEKFIYSFDGKRTNTGRVYVSEKPNWGHGFEVIGEVGRDYYDDYEYWCYQEDDHYIIPTGEGYFAEAIKQLKENDKLKCVSFSPIKAGVLPQFCAHFGGAYGVWHRSRMDMKAFPFTKIGVRSIPFYTGEGSICGWLLNSFEPDPPTGDITEGAFTEIRNYSNAPENWTDLGTYVVCSKDPKIKVTIEEPFIFKVGL